MIELLNTISESWWNWMYDMFWQVSLLIIIISFIDLLIRKWAWPQLRYAIWALVIVKLFIPPTFSFDKSIVYNIRQFTEQQSVSDSKELTTQLNNNSFLVDSELQYNGEINNTANSSNINKEESNVLTAKQAIFNWQSYLMIFWIVGIILFSGILVIKITKLKKWHIQQKNKIVIPEWFHNLLLNTANKLSIEKIPTIVFSNEISTPAVYGFFRPVFLLPEKYINTLTEEQAEHILLHELAHVKRGDLFVHGICLFVQIIYWFNPLLIWVKKQMKHVRELCCDLTIANILREKTIHYRKTLVITARELLTKSTSPATVGLVGLFEEPYRLVSRLKWLEKKSWKNRKGVYVFSFISCLLFSAFVLPMGNDTKQFFIFPTQSITLKSKVLDYKEKVNKYSTILNEAFIDWDLEKIEKYYTDDVVISQEGRPTFTSKEEFMFDLKSRKNTGLIFNSLENLIVKIWKNGNFIYSIESTLYTITLTNLNLSFTGNGKSVTMWEIQEDSSLKVKYAIMNVNELNPTKINY